MCVMLVQGWHSTKRSAPVKRAAEEELHLELEMEEGEGEDVLIGRSQRGECRRGGRRGRQGWGLGWRQGRMQR